MESLIARLIELPPQTPNTLSPETYIAGSRGLRHNHLQAKLLGLFHHGSDLLRAVPGFVVFGAFVDVLLAAFDEPVDRQASLRAIAVMALGAPSRVRSRRYCAPR